MSGCWRVFRAELYRLVRSRALLFSALFVAAVAALRVHGEQVLQRAGHAAAVQKALSRGAEAPPAPDAANAYAPWVEGWVSGLTVGTLLLLVLAARSLAADRESGVLRLARTRSAGRGALVAGRLLLGVPLVLGLVAVTGLASWATAAALFEFGDLVEHGYTILTAAELDAELTRSVAAVLPPLFALWAFGLALSAVIRSPTAAVGACLAAYLGFDLFKAVLGEGQWWVFASFAPSFVDGSALHEMAGVARGLSDMGYGEARLMMNWTLPLPQALLLGAVAWVATWRRAL